MRPDAATRITAKEKLLAPREARRTTPCKDSMRESQQKGGIFVEVSGLTKGSYC